MSNTGERTRLAGLISSIR